MRLQKYIADCGITSRRKAEELIIQGKVSVNGNVVTELGTKVIPNIDKVEYNGKEIKIKDEDYIYIILNKPIGYVTTVHDQFNRETVLDLIKTDKRLVPVREIRYVYFRSVDFNE